MARSSGRDPRPLTAGSFVHTPSQVRYDIDKSGLVKLSRGTAQEERQLSYFFGSGAAGHSFGYVRNGFLFEAPVTWYAQTGSWDVSPGYESDTSSRWSRPLDPTCLYCHASQPRSVESTLNKYADPAFEQDGVGCERCHGPGSLHAQGKAKMLNPASLSPPLRDSVCAQCHLTGQSRVARAGRRIEDYRPGDDLRDFVAVFVPVNSNGFQVNSHVEKLAESTCKRAAGDKLWCATCHDPHSTPAVPERAAWYRGKCLGCHQTSECNRGFDCAACHMPKNHAADANHGVFTDHSIPRVPGAVRNQSAASWNLRGFTAKDKGERELGLAYADIGVRTDNRNQQAEAMRLLLTVLASGKGDAQVQARLADLEERAGNPKQAIALYQAALRGDPNSVFAMVNLGRLYGSTGLLDEAIGLWRAALERNPCLPEAGANLQLALRARKDKRGAEEVRRSQEFCVF